MKAKQLLRSTVLLAAFGMSYLGFSSSSTTEKIAGEEVTISSLSLTSAQACNEESTSVGLGTCNGFGRCAYSGSTGNCRS